MTKELYRNVTVQLQGDDESPVQDAIIEESLFLQAAFSLNLARVVAGAADDVNTKGLGELWDDVPPKDGGYSFEIGTALPYYLPTFDGANEYIVAPNGHKLIVSLRMIQCYFSEPSKPAAPLNYYLIHRRGLPSLIEQLRLEHIHPVPLKTFIAKPLEVKGNNAEQLLQANYHSWVKEFVEDVSKLLDAIRTASPKDAKQLLPHSGTSLLPIFWICVRGADDKTGFGKFAGDVPTIAFRSVTNLKQDDVERVNQLLIDGEASVQESALALASTYLHHGQIGLAFVQVCIACESMLAQAYKDFLTSRGVSSSKYEASERDLTYSALLNLHLAAMRDLSELDDSETVLSRLNFARNRRNEMVHEGKMKKVATDKDVEMAIAAAKSLIEFLDTEPQQLSKAVQ